MIIPSPQSQSINIHPVLETITEEEKEWKEKADYDYEDISYDLVSVYNQKISKLEDTISDLQTKLHKARKGKKRWKNRCLRVTSDYAKLAEENRSLKEECERLIIKEQNTYV